MRLGATRSRVTGAGAVKPSLFALAMRAIRRNNGTLIGIPDNALGDGQPNLLSAPEDFAGSSWTKLGVAQVTSGVSDPFGETNACRLTANGGGLSYFQRAVSVVSGDVSFSAHLKAGNATWAALWFNGIGVGAYINLSTGQLGTVSAGVSAQVVSNTGGWIRVNVSRTASAGSQDFAVFAAKGNGNATMASGDYIDVFGAKLELGPTATAYTPQSVLRQRGVYQDSTGTMPLTAVGDVLGLLTDRSYGAGNLGVNDSTGHWLNTWPTAFDTFTSTGAAEFSGSTSTAKTGIRVAVSCGKTLTPGATYRVSFVPTFSGASGFVMTFATSTLGGAGGAVGPLLVAGVPFTIVMTVPNSGTASTNLVFILNTAGVATFGVTDFMCREVLGNHATQSAASQKPVVTRVPKRLGPNLVTNGTFDSGTTGWGGNNGGAISVSGGELTVTNSIASSGRGYQMIPTEANKPYLMTSFARAGAAWAIMGWGTLAGSSAGGSVLTASAQLLQLTFVATAASTSVTLQTNTATAGHTASFDNIEVREVLEWTNAISFDGSNDFLQTGITTGNEGWICAGVTPLSLAANQVVFSSGAQAAGDPGISLKIRSTGAVWAGRANASTVDIATSASGAAVVNAQCVIDAEYTTTGATIRKDGASIATSGVSITALASTNPLRIGAVAGASPSEYINGSMSATVYTPVLPSAADRALIRRWIGSLQGQSL